MVRRLMMRVFNSCPRLDSSNASNGNDKNDFNRSIVKLSFGKITGIILYLFKAIE